MSKRLIPYVRNARTHSGDQIAQIAGSIAEFGFVNPVLIGADDVIIAGHGRVLAAEKLGLDYEKYLAEIVALTKKAKNPAAGATYPAAMNTAAKRALYDNLGEDEALATALDAEIRKTKKDDWRGNKFKEKEVRNAIRTQLSDPAQVDLIFDLVRNQHEY